jgi:hypothetical protein
MKIRSKFRIPPETFRALAALSIMWIASLRIAVVGHGSGTQPVKRLVGFFLGAGVDGGSDSGAFKCVFPRRHLSV